MTDRPFGKCVLWNESRGFGFIAPDAGGGDIFCHVKNVESGDDVLIGDRVSYETTTTADGRLRASRVRVVRDD